MTMQNESTAIVEQDGGWFVACTPEVPGANGQGKTREEAMESLTAAIELILEDRREEASRDLPHDARRSTVPAG
jgi:predicted RNase H-like HicB family nuclease